ncbi:hypothetical protein K3217_06275 [bacterium BD-1]|nr:hypothetical protein [Ottowia caeni]
MNPIPVISRAALAAFFLLAATAEAGTIETVAGNGNPAYSGDGGPATQANVDAPTAVVGLPGTQAFYFAGGTTIRRVDEQGIISTVAGQGDLSGGTAGYSGDGGPATAALLSGVTSLAIHPASGDLFMVDRDNARVRRIDSQGVITTFAGTGQHLFTADPGPAAERPLRWPLVLTFDAGGTLYIADHSSIRKVGPDGVMQRIAGDGTVGYNGDDIPAVGAKLNAPDGLVAALDGNLYISDRGNGRLRKIDANGIISTVAALSPTGLATDVHGNLYFGKSGSARIDRYLPHLQATEPVAGTGVAGFSGDGGPALEAKFGTLVSLAVSESGELYIADHDNWRVRRVASPDAQLPRADFEGDFVEEGDEGTTPATFRVRLDRPAPAPVRFTASTFDMTATGDHDYVPLTAEVHEIAAGASEASFVVQVNGDRYVEGHEDFRVEVTFLSGALMSSGGYVGTAVGAISDDDTAGPSVFFLREDREIVAENATRRQLTVTSNDSADIGPDGGLSIVTQPARGVVELDFGILWYTPNRDWTGEDEFTYRLCETADRCLQAKATLVVRPLGDVYLSVLTHAGRERIGVGDLRALPGAKFLATPLVAPVELDFDLGVDTAPQSPWDSTDGVAWQVRTIPAGAQARTLKVLAMDGGETPFNSTLYLGRDLDGDGRPSAGEQGCIQDESLRRCELTLAQAAGQSVSYWVMLHSRNAEPQMARVDVFEVAQVEGDGRFFATAPGHLPAGQDFDLTLAWDDPTFLAGQERAAYVRVFADGATPTGEFPVILRRDLSVERPIRLVDGVTTQVGLDAGGTHKSIYMDVPAGTTRLRVTSQSDANVDLHLVPALYASGSTTGIAPVPEPYQPVAVGEGATGSEDIVVQAGLVQPARWYVVAYNRDGSPASVSLTATLEAAAPVVRPGSYFNEARSGHGLFLYPAGGVWAGLWYTYREDGSPTWYYLQAPAPGAKGVWTSPIYRAAWDGDSNHLVEVGSATVTPGGPDVFRFSYSIDGLAGSEAMASLGRGCPSLDGSPQDLSSHWFDPAHAGTGYSVQMLANYEFMAAFVYDGLGEPRFLVAERTGFGDADDVLDVEQLGGACPTCTYYGRPQRATVGTLRRVLGGGTLQSMELDAVFTIAPLNRPIPGAWSSVDAVVPLGGPGTTQGCAP